MTTVSSMYFKTVMIINIRSVYRAIGLVIMFFRVLLVHNVFKLC